MQRAFSVRFPSADEDEHHHAAPEQELDDDPSVWEANVDGFEDALDLVSGKRARLSCFTHSLPLTIGDGLKEMKAIGLAISKCSSISTQLHCSTKLKEAFEQTFGSKASLPASNTTRWNSTYLLRNKY